MNRTAVHIHGMGIVSPLGLDLDETRAALIEGRRCLGPLSLFAVAGEKSMPVGEVTALIKAGEIPRTHCLARLAAIQAMAGSRKPPDAVVMGVTTGGMAVTENHLKTNQHDPDLFKWHAINSVAEDIAAIYQCRGPVITVSTACSSGSAAIKIALEMIRTGKAARVLVGGADSLCRLTYHGFLSLQLIDPNGARPFDQDRRGMSVAEGAAMLLLGSDEPEKAVAEILGAGLSCDAHHPTAPHPDGLGALAAMQAAVADAGIAPCDIDYVNLHGTGTMDNDRAEARAVRAYFGSGIPLLSSIKGACGHSLAAAGAIEAVVAAIAVSDGFVPANSGCRQPDPELEINLVQQPLRTPIRAVLSNSFGFGGNNAAVVIARPGEWTRADGRRQAPPLSILGAACITGKGNTEKTMAAIRDGQTCDGMISMDGSVLNLPPREIRRLKRLPRLALSLAIAAHRDGGEHQAPTSVFFGTGWGALSETHDFLTRLYETGEQFPSPTDFVGSVHNAPAGQIAMWFKAKGPCMTTSGGDYSFEQALLTADLCISGQNDCILVAGADETHPELSGLFDRSVTAGETLSDGGGAFLMTKATGIPAPTTRLLFYENARQCPEVMTSVTSVLGGREQMGERYGLILAGIPADARSQGEMQLATLLALSDFQHPVAEYRKWTGEFASASAVAAVLAVKCLEQNLIPGVLWGGADMDLGGKGIVLIGLGRFVTALEIMPP